MSDIDHPPGGLRRIGTPLGDVYLDLSVPGCVRARAGDASLPPLRCGGREVAVSLALVRAPGALAFSLLAEDAPLAWDAVDPRARLPRPTWKAVAACVLDAVESFIADNPGLAHVADLAALRGRLAEIDEDLDAAGAWVAELRDERARLSERVGPLRRTLLRRVG